MILVLLFAFLQFMLSGLGFFFLMLGFVAFIISPIFFRIFGVGKGVAHFPLWLVARLMNRCAIVVSEHNDILLKRMTFDDLGVETIRFGDERKEFEDPDGALHTWKGATLALADEVSGVLFDPRHAALGARKHEADERSEGKVFATESEWEQEGISEWVKGVFEMPTDFELVDLSDVRHLVDGGERSEYPKRVEELYKNSRQPFASGTPATKFMWPILGFLGTFGGIWLIVDQLASGDGADRTIGWAILWLLISLQPLRDVDWKHLAKVAIPTLLLSVLVILLYAVLGLVFATIALFTFALGFFLLPIIALASKKSKLISLALARFLLIIGFLGYDRPVFKWTPRGYEIVEHRELGDTETVTWYNLGNSLIGFTFEPTEDSWGPEVMRHSEVEDKQMRALADGGEETNIPTGYVPMNMGHRGSVGAFGPKRVRHGNYYLHSGIALARFEDSARGEKSMKRLTWAKEQYGEDDFAVSDKAVLYMTGGAMLIGIVLGTLVFLL